MDSLTTQKDFDGKYISTVEIMSLLNVSRTALLYAKRKGWLPNAISINDGQLFLWERDKLQPHLEEWQRQLKRRRGE